MRLKKLIYLILISLGTPGFPAAQPNGTGSGASYPKSDSLRQAEKPLYRDPVHDGAADPVVIWNKPAGKWFMYYTNRRADIVDEEGVSWVHGTRIGIAVSQDGGASWQYLDTCDIGYRVTPEYTCWAPEVIENEGAYHMYLTYVPGIFKDWGHPRWIVHLTSVDGIGWTFESRLHLASEMVLDACVFQLPDGKWRLWYNNEKDGKSMYYADSPDLFQWTDIGKMEGFGRGEGAKVFQWKGFYWMVADEWDGLAVYRSGDLQHWEKQSGNLLREPGTGKDDRVKGGHCDVVVQGDRAYIFYFTHPGRREEVPDSAVYEQQRSSIQVAELLYRDGWITCDRDRPVYIHLTPE
jgi:beta-xylosidase